MFFANDNRDKVREENPGISFGMFFLFSLNGAYLTTLQVRLASSLVTSGRL